jgi:ankyrin repeat protein
MLAAAGNADMVRSMLADGADPNEPSSGWVPLQLARTGEIAEALIDGGARVNLRGPDDGWSPLFCAVDKDRLDVAAVLLRRGADPRSVSFGMVPLHVTRSAAMVRLLVAFGADINAREQTDRDFLAPGATPLCAATTDEAAAALIDAGAGVRAADRAGRTPLHRAAEAGWVRVAGWLVEKAADVNARDAQGRTPLHAARSAAMVWLLVEHKAEVDALDETTRATPLCTATNAEAAAALIDAGADVRAADRAGRTPLHRAAEGGWVKVARRLTEKGADVNARDAVGRTPLHYTASDELAAALVAGGAKADIADHDGRRPDTRNPAGSVEERVVKGMTIDEVTAAMGGRPSLRIAEPRSVVDPKTKMELQGVAEPGTGHEGWWYHTGGGWLIEFDEGRVTRVQSKPVMPPDPPGMAYHGPGNRTPLYVHDRAGR